MARNLRLSSELELQAIAAKRRGSPWQRGTQGATVYAKPPPPNPSSVTFTLPFPPSVNHASGPREDGGRYLTEEHRAFRSEVAMIVLTRRAQYRYAGRLAVSITLYAADRTRFDIDNRVKPLLDALQHAAVFLDDSQIDRLEITRVTSGERACAVTVSEIAP